MQLSTSQFVVIVLVGAAIVLVASVLAVFVPRYRRLERSAGAKDSILAGQGPRWRKSGRKSGQPRFSHWHC